MASDNEINEKIDIFSKKIKKKIYKISALKHKGHNRYKKSTGLLICTLINLKKL